MNKTNLSLLAFFCFTLILAGCNGKSVSSATADPAVISTAGKWSLIRSHVVSGDSSVKFYMDTTNSFPSGINNLFIHTDGTFGHYIEGVKTDSGSYEIKDNSISLRDHKYPDLPTKMLIITLTEHKMVLVEDKDMSGMRMRDTLIYTR